MTSFRAILTLVLLAGSVSAGAIALSRPDPMLAVVAVVNPQGHGTGFAIDAHTVVTNRHVVEDAKGDVRKLGILTLLGGKATVRAVYRAEGADIAILTVSPALPHSLPVVCGWPKRGQRVMALGHPLMAAWAEYRGRIASDLPVQAEDRPMVALDVGINSGMSGGPVIDGRGRVVAVTVAVLMQQMGQALSGSHSGLAIPGKVLCAVIERARASSEEAEK